MSDAITEMRITPVNRPLDLFPIRVEKKLVRIEPLPLFWSIRTIDAVSIQLAGTYLGQIAVPHHVGLLGKGYTQGFTPSENVKEAQLNFFRML
jgi:hypothetical protein